MRHHSDSWARRVASAAALTAASFLATACVHHHDHAGHRAPEVHRAPEHARHGPPAHAPAHGYRKKHPKDGIEMVFDAEVGVYAVVSHSGVYWDGSRYIRWGHDGWTASARIDSVWVSVSSGDVPRTLRARHPASEHKAKGRAHPHGHAHPAKRSD